MERGGSVAEFPTTLQAAEAARERGMPVVMGAPNLLRGSSHNGKLRRGSWSGGGWSPRSLRTTCRPDCWPPCSRWPATDWSPCRGDRLVTSGPADVAGLADRGRLVPGLRADLALIATGPLWPVVQSVLVSAR